MRPAPYDALQGDFMPEMAAEMYPDINSPEFFAARPPRRHGQSE